MARVADVYERELDNSLKISTDKPLGSFGFPLSNPWGLIKLAAWAVKESLLGNSKGTEGLLSESGDTKTLWVYRWHVAGLLEVLKRHDETFRGAGCYLQDEDGLSEVVQWIRAHPAIPKTPIYDAIADCYGDKLNPGRTDVLPGVDPHQLLDAYQTFSGGVPDPAAIYFTLAAHEPPPRSP
jgi:hypothetical protein